MSTTTDHSEPEPASIDDTETGVMASVSDALDGLRDTASVTQVFGDPIEANGKTVVPVARVAYGFGAGYGSDTGENGEPAETAGEGGGGGGGAAATPVGVLEISDDDTRFVRFSDWKRAAVALAAGVGLGVLLGRR